MDENIMKPRTSYRGSENTVGNKIKAGLSIVRENIPTISNVTSYGNEHMINGVYTCIRINRS